MYITHKGIKVSHYRAPLVYNFNQQHLPQNCLFFTFYYVYLLPTEVPVTLRQFKAMGNTAGNNQPATWKGISELTF